MVAAVTGDILTCKFDVFSVSIVDKIDSDVYTAVSFTALKERVLFLLSFSFMAVFNANVPNLRSVYTSEKFFCVFFKTISHL